ncbi:hypothetical protein HET69_14495 [Streptomyces sp. CJ_13]|uniref:hypothetical protein n=1 Tax=Streptomyces sp. CJ_13 TaxID=2724943 RepID=UPI001BDCCEDF|nr:hypothetical protein [Streptomyces sp. CJ_13]MBT1185188.1 hypothetical protein [Streptomyces sp. CJ_13]
MSASELGGESTGEESGREPARPAGEPAPRSRRSGRRRLVSRVFSVLAVEAVQTAVSVWAPEWSEAAQIVTTVVRVVRLGRARGGRPRG